MKLRLGSMVALCFITMFGMSACVKDYICQCQISYTGQPGLPDTTIKEYNITDTKKKAKSTCESNSSASDRNGIHTVVNCYLY